MFDIQGFERTYGQFCVTDEQRAGASSGVYKDHDHTSWNWQCAPDPVDTADDDAASNTSDFDTLDPFNNYEDKAMEWLLWITHISAAFWFFGLPIMLPLGWSLLVYLQILAFFQLFETDLMGGEILVYKWLVGQGLRAYVTQPIIFIMSVMWSFVPGVNWITAFLFGWWACADYYSYSYELFGGP